MPVSVCPADHFYLVVPSGEAVEEDNWALLKKPFDPFHRSLWLSMVLFLFVAAAVFILCAGPDEEDFHNYPTWSAALQNYARGTYLAFSGPKDPRQLDGNCVFFIFWLLSGFCGGPGVCTHAHGMCMCACSTSHKTRRCHLQIVVLQGRRAR